MDTEFVIRRVGGLEGARTHPTFPGGVIRRVGGLEGMYAPEVLARLVIRRVGGLEGWSFPSRCLSPLSAV